MASKVVSELNALLKELRKEDFKLHYDILKKIFLDPELFKEIAFLEKKLYNKISYLYYHGFLTEADKRKVLELIGSLVKQLNAQKNTEAFKNLQFIVTQLEEWVTHEKEYLDYKPGAERKEYVRLTDLLRSPDKTLVIDKEKLELRNNERVYYADREIQGVKVIFGEFFTNIEITGEHYASEKSIREIYQNKALISSRNRLINFGLDPYCYLAEPGKLNNQNINEIRKILGARDAEGCITVKIILNINRVWIRVKRNYPAKFAIEAKAIPIAVPKPQKGYRIRIKEEIEYLAA